MTQVGECTHQIHTAPGEVRWVLPHPTRLDKVLICPQEENTVHPLFLTRQDTGDSSTNGRSNPVFPLCPLSWHVCSKACPDIITGLHALPQQCWKGYFARSMCTPPDSFWGWAKKQGTGHNCPNCSHSIFSGTAAEHTESGLQDGWMVLVVATFNHYFSGAILSPSSATLQILKFRGLQHITALFVQADFRHPWSM